MLRRVVVAAAYIGIAVALGCTSVQKGTAAGGVLGTGTGAFLGHSASSVGSGPGALFGLAAGAAGGAIAAEHFYGPEETGELDVASDELDALRRQMQAKDAELAQLGAALERERAQQRALLQAYEKARQAPQRQEQPTRTASLQMTVPAGVQVTEEEDKVTFTILAGVLFGSGKAGLSSPGKGTLAAMARSIRQHYPDAPIEVRGHTDNVPIRYSKWKSNYELSCARAQTVVDYMIQSHGFDRSQFTVTGCGQDQPVASNATSAGRAKNRRAEIVVYREPLQVASGTGF